jgi:hypothetical protein
MQEKSKFEFEQSFDVVPLPSGGIFYGKDGEIGCEKVKIFHLNGSDDAILTAPNLIANGEMIDVLLDKKIAPADGYDKFVKPIDMTVGDRAALLIFLRSQLEPMYKFPVIDHNGVTFIHNFNLGHLKMKRLEDMETLPNKTTKLYTFEMPKSKGSVEFRPMFASDDKEIRAIQKSTPSDYDNYNDLKQVRVIQSINGNNDKMWIRSFLANANLLEVRKLNNFMRAVIPTFDMEITVPSPSGGTAIKTFLGFNEEFFYPSLD